MRRIVVATDFSTRSDRAIRRGIILAKATRAELELVNAVDDDQPKGLIDLEAAEATRLLAAQTTTMKEIDGVQACYRVVIGDTFSSITNAVRECAADVLIVGPHRRQALQDIFVGTSAERIIRTSGSPVIMANAPPVAAYRHILLATDLSAASAEALRAATRLNWGEKPAFSIFHAYDAPERAMRGAFAVSESDIQRFLDEAQRRARAEVASFIRNLNIQPVREIVELMNAEAATMIRKAAQDIGADLIVIGRQGGSGLARLILGGVAEAVLRSAETDVLVVPSPAATV